MKFVNDNGTAEVLRFEKPFRDVLQRWRISLASLLFFILVMMDSSDFCMKVTNATLDYLSSHTPITQCLPLSRTSSANICDTHMDRRTNFIRDHDMRLNFCTYHKVVLLVNTHDSHRICRVNGTRSSCERCLRSLEELDSRAYAMYSSFKDVIERRDCSSYTMVNCSQCMDAYRTWLCSTMIPYYLNETVVPPCGEFCVNVQEKCPFLRTTSFDTHAGDPAFLCKDSLGHQGTQDVCYNLCHLKYTHSNHDGFHNNECPNLIARVEKTRDNSSSTSSASCLVRSCASLVSSFLVPLIVYWCLHRCLVRTFLYSWDTS